MAGLIYYINIGVHTGRVSQAQAKPKIFRDMLKCVYIFYYNALMLIL